MHARGISNRAARRSCANEKKKKKIRSTRMKWAYWTFPFSIRSGVISGPSPEGTRLRRGSFSFLFLRAPDSRTDDVKRESLRVARRCMQVCRYARSDVGEALHRRHGHYIQSGISPAHHGEPSFRGEGDDPSAIPEFIKTG